METIIQPKKPLHKKILSELVPISMALVMLSMIAAFIYLTIPYTHWFNYVTVEPVQKDFCIGTHPSFKSFRDVKRDVKIEWQETQYCKVRGEFTKDVKRVDAGTLKKTDDTEWSERAWYFGQANEYNDELPMPTFETECYLLIEAIKVPPFNFLRTFFDKTQTFESLHYNFKQC